MHCIGDLFVIKGDDGAGLEWLYTRAHPDEQTLFLIVPVDRFTLAGGGDLRLSGGRTARCGESHWLPADTLGPKVDSITQDELKLVRRKVSNLAHGRLPVGPCDDDNDPEYEAHMALVEEARRKLP
jgi:hypothetical protein